MLFFARNNGMAESTHFIMIMLQTSYAADPLSCAGVHKDELIARIQAIVRRSQGHAQSVIQIGDLVLNLDSKTVEVNGARLHLTVKEYQMLELLCLHKDRPVTKEMFLNHLYGG